MREPGKETRLAVSVHVHAAHATLAHARAAGTASATLIGT